MQSPRFRELAACVQTELRQGLRNFRPTSNQTFLFQAALLLLCLCLGAKMTCGQHWMMQGFRPPQPRRLGPTNPVYEAGRGRRPAYRKERARREMGQRLRELAVRIQREPDAIDVPLAVCFK